MKYAEEFCVQIHLWQLKSIVLRFTTHHLMEGYSL